MRFLFGVILFSSQILLSNESILSLGIFGSVRYTYEENLLKIDRITCDGEIAYTHSYHFDEQGRLLSEDLIGELGTIVYNENELIESPYSLEICEYDANHNLIKHIQDKEFCEYAYNAQNELISETSQVDYEYAAGKLVRKNHTYFDYDESDRLTRVSSSECEVVFTYDSFGKRISKSSKDEYETYSYLGSNEIASFIDDKLKQLRIPGLSWHKDILKPIAIETPEAIYAPIHNRQGNIIKLINIANREVISLDSSDPFGRDLSKTSPTSWIFSGKSYDGETGLVYFGSRYYCPEIKKWLTSEPENQNLDPYQYCFNNPHSYADPDGRFVIAIPLVWGLATLGQALVDSAILSGVLWFEHRTNKKANERDREHERKKQFEKNRREMEETLQNMDRNKKTEIDPNLPGDPFNHPDWEEISHEKEKQYGHHKFRNKNTEEKIGFDRGKRGEPGHRGRDHFHRYNPNSKNNTDLYLDKNGKPIAKSSPESHLYPN